MCCGRLGVGSIVSFMGHPVFVRVALPEGGGQLSIEEVHGWFLMEEIKAEFEVLAVSKAI